MVEKAENRESGWSKELRRNVESSRAKKSRERKKMKMKMRNARNGRRKNKSRSFISESRSYHTLLCEPGIGEDRSHVWTAMRLQNWLQHMRGKGRSESTNSMIGFFTRPVSDALAPCRTRVSRSLYESPPRGRLQAAATPASEEGLGDRLVHPLVDLAQADNRLSWQLRV